MNNEKFYNDVMEKVKEHYGEKANVFLSDVTKNNGLMKKGLCVRINGSNCGPTIYLNDFYEDFRKGKSLDLIMDDIIKLFEEYAVDGKVDLSFVSDFNAIYNKICFRLVDSVRNEEKLRNMPYRLIEDLAVTYYIALETLGIEGSIAINDKLMSVWEVTEEDLFEAAIDNTPRFLPAEIVPMGEFLGERTGRPELAVVFPKDDFLVASNEKYLGGATVILYPGLLGEVGDRIGNDFYIIPSSRHEVILISETAVKNGAFNLKDMVKCVNDTCVLPEDVLSDNLYYYDRSGDNIKKVEYVKDTMVL